MGSDYVEWFTEEFLSWLLLVWADQVFEEFFLFKLRIPCRGAVWFAIWSFCFALGTWTAFLIIVITTTTLSKSLNTVVTVFIVYLCVSLKKFKNFIRLSHFEASRYAKAPSRIWALCFAGRLRTAINSKRCCAALNKFSEAFVFLNFLAMFFSLATFIRVWLLYYAL